MIYLKCELCILPINQNWNILIPIDLTEINIMQIILMYVDYTCAASIAPCGQYCTQTLQSTHNDSSTTGLPAEKSYAIAFVGHTLAPTQDGALSHLL